MESAQPAQQNVAHDLLERAHSPETSERIFTERVKQKPLFLRPTSPTPEDNRSRRRLHRLRKKEYFLRKQKPKPLTAREKRELGIHDLPKEEVRYEIFKSLNEMWAEYMRDVLGVTKQTSRSPPVITSTNHGSLLVSADYHGAEMEVVRSRCVSRVGVKGFVVRDSKFAFVLVTEKNEMKSMCGLLLLFLFLFLYHGLHVGETRNELTSISRLKLYLKSTLCSGLRYPFLPPMGRKNRR